MADSLTVQIRKAMEEQIKPKLKKDIDSSLDKSVAPVVKRIERENVYNYPYDRPHPHYVRREDSGGLSDVRNMHHTVENGSLAITNDTPPNPCLNGYDYSLKIHDGIEWHEHGASSTPRDRSTAALVEYNYVSPRYYGYDYANPEGDPRFTYHTIEELKREKQHKEVLKKSLGRKGYKVK